MAPIGENFGRWLRGMLNPLNPVCQHYNQHCDNTWIKWPRGVSTQREGLWSFLEEKWKMTHGGLWEIENSWLIYGTIVTKSPICVTHTGSSNTFQILSAKLLCWIQNKNSDWVHLLPSTITYKLKMPGGREYSKCHPSAQGSTGPKTLISFSRGPISSPPSVC